MRSAERVMFEGGAGAEGCNDGSPCGVEPHANERPLSVTQMNTEHGTRRQEGYAAAHPHGTPAHARRAPPPTVGGRGEGKRRATERGGREVQRGADRRRRGCRAGGDKSSEPRLNLSGSWQQGHSAAYNTPFLIQVVCKGFIGPGPEIVIARGSGRSYRCSWRPRAGGRLSFRHGF